MIWLFHSFLRMKRIFTTGGFIRPILNNGTNVNACHHSLPSGFHLTGWWQLPSHSNNMLNNTIPLTPQRPQGLILECSLKSKFLIVIVGGIHGYTFGGALLLGPWIANPLAGTELSLTVLDDLGRPLPCRVLLRPIGEKCRVPKGATSLTIGPDILFMFYGSQNIF